MNATQSGTLRVPGATLYYKIRGSGPLLLILQGGEGDAEGCEGLANHLLDHFSVLTYDRRGLSRSTLDDPAESPRLETHGDDAHYLLAALTHEPAYVFGGSLGALLGLDLVTRYSAQVRTLVAHEPPAPELLPDAEQAEVAKSQEDMAETYRREGTAGAIQKMTAGLLMDFRDREPDVELPQLTGEMALRRAANLRFFFAHDAGAVRRYKLNVAALQAAPTRIVAAAGVTSRDQWLYHCTRALAERLGTDLVEFPGGHNGYILFPRAFAAQLRGVLVGGPAALTQPG